MSCTILSDEFGIFVQIFLLSAAIFTLVYKRHREIPQRPLLIWGFDSSKQAFAGALQHGTNMFLGLFFGSKNGLASECSWYIVNFTITSFCGLFIIYWVMKLYNYMVDKHKLTILKSGYYGTPPRVKAWVLQMAIWGVISCVEKLTTAVVIILPLYKYIDKFAYWIETPLIPYPQIELVIVMVLLPAIINCIFFYVCDNIIKEKKSKNEPEYYSMV